ncbi:RNA polymerase sigma factor, sigma-70 family [Candidatus Desulfosporosinus infrequens]|uniref:RNA polymerase sigma factor, sigma-70 family n=1 Tax=Candidatus Desulfosporosinus infrequens TaxID=2043169 RepID=A0A2U3JWU3_9FIRM|nr:RNA polymerase sigma factor, sigma-70 family [Candidatus Desulfosporosinus infrequens]
MNIKYEFVTGEIVEIEVPDEIGEVSIELDRAIYNSDQRETRRHKSYSDANDKLEVLEDLSEDIEEKVFSSLEHEVLNKAIAMLLPQQQALVHKVFFEGNPIVSVAKELGITKQACNNRLNKIYVQLKKYF